MDTQVEMTPLAEECHAAAASDLKAHDEGAGHGDSSEPLLNDDGCYAAPSLAYAGAAASKRGLRSQLLRRDRAPPTRLVSRLYRTAFILFYLFPLTLYLAGVISVDWAEFKLLPGTRVQNNDDDDSPDDWRRHVAKARPIMPFTANIVLGLWSFRVENSRLNTNITGMDGLHTISHCDKSSYHHRVGYAAGTVNNAGCAQLCATRAFLILAIIVSGLFLLMSLGIKLEDEPNLSALSVLPYVGLLASVPGLCAMMAWAIFYSHLAQDARVMGDFLPLVKPGLVYASEQPLGMAQRLVLAAWVLQLLPLAVISICSIFGFAWTKMLQIRI